MMTASRTLESVPASGAGTSGPSRSASITDFLIPSALLLVFILQCSWFETTQSITFDESIHTAVAQDVWRQHRFDHWMETPPLGHLLIGLPIYGSKFQMQIRNPQGWLVVTGLTPSPERFIVGPRMMNVMLGLLLAILVWCATKNLFSAAAANFVLSLFIFVPQFIAHYTLATVDGIGVLTVFALAYQSARWRQAPSWPNTVLMGIAIGLSLLAKFYALPFAALAILAMLLTTKRIKPAGVEPAKTKNDREFATGFSLSPSRWSWIPALSSVAIACFIVWAGYFFHVGRASIHNQALTICYPTAQTNINLAGSSVGEPGLNLSVPLPAPEFFAGIYELWLHNQLGHPSFLLGQVYRDAPPHWYFPVVIALKWPTITLLLAFAGLVLFFKPWPPPNSKRSEAAIYLAFGALALLLALWARLGIGDRHVLTLLPFLLVFAGGCWHWASGLHSPRRRIAIAALVLLGVLNTADSFRYAPGYLSYFNIFVSPDRGWEFVTDSSLDWGQGLLALRAYQQQHPETTLHLAYFGSVDPSIYGIRALPLRPGDRVTGTVVVSATLLSGQYLSHPEAYRWLLQFKPVAVLDHCLWVFDVPQQNE